MKKYYLLVLILTLSVVGLSACGSDDTASGEELVDKNCSSCHGKGLGGGLAVALNEDGKGYSEDELRTAITDGVDTMPADLLEGEDLDAAVEYLLTIQPE